jgi:hypothetical protein
MPLLVASALAVAACSPAASPGGLPGVGAVTQDAATRASPVVVGRPARVFVYVALGPKCEPLAAPAIRVVTPPEHGEVALREGQQTTIAAASSSACVGRTASGTGIYYTARRGAGGSDRFTVEARAADGTVQSRTFEVRIEQ